MKKVSIDTRHGSAPAQPEVRPGPIGTTGYCMGGLMPLTAAGTCPDRSAVWERHWQSLIALFDHELKH